jgi:hypothetical protein
MRDETEHLFGTSSFQRTCSLNFRLFFGYMPIATKVAMSNLPRDKRSCTAIRRLAVRTRTTLQAAYLRRSKRYSNPITGLDRGQALRVPRGSGSQVSRQSAHAGGEVFSPTHRPLLPPRKYFWY